VPRKYSSLLNSPFWNFVSFGPFFPFKTLQRNNAPRFYERLNQEHGDEVRAHIRTHKEQRGVLNRASNRAFFESRSKKPLFIVIKKKNFLDIKFRAAVCASLKVYPEFCFDRARTRLIHKRTKRTRIDTHTEIERERGVLYNDSQC